MKPGVRHSVETRRRALELMAAGSSVSAVGRALGVSRCTLGRWRLLDDLGTAPKPAPPERVVARLGCGLTLEGEAIELATVLAALGFEREKT